MIRRSAARHFALALTLAMLLCHSGPLLAQTDRLPRTAPAVRPRTSALDLAVTVSEAQDGDPGEISPALTGLPPASRYSNLDAQVTFVRSVPHVSVASRLETAWLYYPTLDDRVASAYLASGALSSAISRKTTFRMNGNARRGSSLSFSTAGSALHVPPTADGPPLQTPAGLLLDTTTSSYGAGLELQRTLGRRTSATVSAGGQYSERSDFGEHTGEGNVGTRLTRSIARDVSFYAGYTGRRSTEWLVHGRRELLTHETAIGGQIRWRRSRDRQTLFDVGVGPGLIDADGVRQPTFSATASMTQEVSNAWSVRAAYRHGAGLINGLTYATWATFDLHGSVHRRLDVDLGTGYSRAELTSITHQPPLQTLIASTMLQFAVTRSLALFFQDVWYQTDATTPAAADSVVVWLGRRGGLRAGAMWRVPLR
jgi:hypothetical protein